MTDCTFHCHEWEYGYNNVDGPILGKEKYDLIMTSPPYNIGKEYEVNKLLDIYLTEQKWLIDQLYSSLKETGSICWQVGNYVNQGEICPLDIKFYDIFKSLGMQLRNRIVWRFGHGLHCKNRFSGRYETVNWWTKTNKYKFNLDAVRVPSKYPNKKHFKGPKKGMLSGNPLGCNPTDVWTIMLKEWEESFWDVPNVKNNHPEKSSHPCQFPVEVAERCILALTDEGDTVLDPYGGSGATSIAAIKNNRCAVYVDNNEEYFILAQERIKMFREGTLKTRAVGTEIYKPC